ncbi:MAG: transporter ATP-binding protein [Microbacterium sp.]|jgi:peptide/nickel transport system ATP-binding protein|uniref:dipeptide ABC transporter ATP-binding protein n=1 Tax=Microbacterium sp. TaxID=51671 RepID=UPI002606D1AD|nr:ABC transporter ATP-binding protein [Microbacterium sp.]MDF2561728.1 transporter ATP-binding protein [Microbacterium sp.]
MNGQLLPDGEDREIVLDVTSLSVSYGPTQVVQDVSFRVRQGETVAIVGESGSGKSTTASAILGLLSPGAAAAGSIRIAGVEVVGASEKTMRGLRRGTLAYVPQDPMSNLDPVHRVGAQVVEVANVVGGRARRDADEHAIAALESAGFAHARERFRQYPHELSGGMRQRALIAMGVINAPQLLIADEPTSALDVTVQRVILDNLESLVERSGTAVILVTHDLGLAAERADRVLVMHRGRVIEHGPSRTVLLQPQADYTRALVAAAPANRAGAASPVSDGTAPVVLALSDVSKTYPARGHGRRRSAAVHAIQDLSLEVRRGQTLAVVGESGSGKSTAAAIALRLVSPTAGSVRFHGDDITTARGRELVEFRRRVQPIFQDPYASLDPMSTVERIITEPLRAFGLGDTATQRRRAAELLELVGLPASVRGRAPSELSGGQRQRVAIARALAPEPEVIICDEPVSALDVLVQANVLDVLTRIQRELGVAYLFISHDLGVVEQIAHDVVVMAAGKVAEAGPTRDVFAAPTDPYTRQLLDSIPGRTLLSPEARLVRP